MYSSFWKFDENGVDLLNTRPDVSVIKVINLI